MRLEAPSVYESAGVDTDKQDRAMALLRPLVEATFALRSGRLGEVKLPLGHFANVIVGGEIAQVTEMIQGERDGYAFDLVGTCVGTVPLDRILDGRAIESGDIVVGIKSSGVHSNGLTLARRIFF